MTFPYGISSLRDRSWFGEIGTRCESQWDYASYRAGLSARKKLKRAAKGVPDHRPHLEPTEVPGDRLRQSGHGVLQGSPEG